MGAEARRPPTATYRLQLSNRFTFADAVAALDYLVELGVSHLYLSPVLASAPGSPHGYDVVDHDRVEPELGGEAGWSALVEAARSRGLGLVVDIVPNHMSVAQPHTNPRWWAALAEGSDSAAGRFFDFLPGPRRVVLPTLGSADDLSRLAVSADSLVLDDRRWPIAPGTGGGSPGEVHARQHYELADWRRGAAEVGYRRFFDISDLAGVRVEEPQVFEASHRRALTWFAAGEVDGLRCDHVDGLADPTGYLDRLASAAGGAWIVVEKILAAGERLPPWPVAGTTGYEAARVVDGVFVDPVGYPDLAETYRRFTGTSADWDDELRTGKREAATVALVAEVERLVSLGAERDAVVEVLTCFPVYRSYLPGSGPEHLAEALAAARRARPDLAPAIQALGERLADPGDELSWRFAQTSGAVMAKGVEDTAMYRYRLLGCLTEVGADPGRFGVTPAEFHDFCQLRERDWPAAMTSRSTHDSKRSADVRLRLALLSEVPAAVADCVGALDAAASAAPGIELDPADRWLAYQSVVGCWPISQERLGSYLVKAAREAGEHTTWTDPDLGYEVSLRQLATLLVSPGCAPARSRLLELLRPAEEASLVSHTLLGLTMPGVPDIYQGDEVESRHLVDPDNRDPLDVAAVAHRHDAKTAVVRAVLHARRRGYLQPGCGYRPWATSSPYLLAFTRGADTLVVAGRLLVGLEQQGGWQQLVLELPPGRWRPAGSPTDGSHAGWCDTLPLASALSGGGVLLVRDPE